jgi:CheY-like chemotaxis protein
MPAGSILVADDDTAIRTVLNQALSRAGYEVRLTGNAATLWRWVSQGSGAVNFARQFGGAIGVNLLSILLERQTQFHAQALTATQFGSGATREMLDTLGALLAQDGIAGGAGEAMARDFLAQAILGQAGMLAFRDTFLAVAVACCVALIPVAIMRHRPKG